MISVRPVSHPLAWKLCAVALLALLGFVLCSRLSHPWTYNDDYNGAFWSQAARNLSHAGFLSTFGVPAPLYFGAPPIPTEVLYVHHPTLLADMMLLDRALLGESESAARMLPILFSVLTAMLLWLFVSLNAGWRLGAFALGFFVAAPMELHYGQMVNFEPPELFFLLGALCCFHLWRRRRGMGTATALLMCCAVTMWTDWQGYLLAGLLLAWLVYEGPARNAGICAALLVTAALCGLGFLLQIHLAAPQSWNELFHAFRERSGQGNLSGGAFTAGQWVRTEATYLATLFHPLAWVLAVMGGVIAWWQRQRLTANERAPLAIGAVLFVIDAVYICVLRNQSYIHDFASFYFLVPLAVFPAFLMEALVRRAEAMHPGAGLVAVMTACLMIGGLIGSGVTRLRDIDTQFCILGDDDTEPATLMPDVGRLIDHAFPANAVVICNFDRYYSPLPYYARRVMVNDMRDYQAWDAAAAQAAPQPAGGIVWMGLPDAADLVRHLPVAETRPVTVDGIPFVLWRARDKLNR